MIVRALIASQKSVISGCHNSADRVHCTSRVAGSMNGSTPFGRDVQPARAEHCGGILLHRTIIKW